MRSAWEQLGPTVLAYRSLTDRTGLPSSRARRRLLTRMLDAHTKHALMTSASIDDPVIIEAVHREVMQHRDRLERLIPWHRALRKAYLELPGEQRFLEDTVGSLFPPAWDATYENEPADDAVRFSRARRIIADLAAEASPFSLVELDRLLADPSVVNEATAEIMRTWHDRPSHTPAVDRSAVTSQLDELAALIVPARGEIAPGAVSLWRTLQTELGVQEFVTASALGLTEHADPSPPVIVADNASRDDAWVAPFRPLDASLRERLARILANAPHPWPESLTAASALDIAIRASTQHLGLAATESRAVFAVAARVYPSVGATKNQKDAAPRGAATYLAVVWRRSEGVTAALERGYGGVHSTLLDFVANPLEYLIGRLWIRLSRTDYDGHIARGADELWEHLKQAVVSSTGHVKTLAQRIAREGFHTASRGLDEAREVMDNRAAIALVEAEERLEHLGAGSAFGAVINYAIRHDGLSTVSQYLSAMGGVVASRQLESELEGQWSSWVHAVALRRLRAVEGDGIGLDEDETRLQRAIGELPAYSQARALIQARRIAGYEGTER